MADDDCETNSTCVYVSEQTTLSPAHGDALYKGTPLYYTYLVLFSLVSFFVCTANFTILGVLCRSAKLKTKTNFLVGSMASGDFGMGLVVPGCFLPYYVLYTTFSDSKAKTFCLTCTCLNVVFLVSAVTSLLCVNAERYVKIVHPFKYQIVITRITVGGLAVTSWLTGLGFGCFLVLSNTWEAGSGDLCTMASFATRGLLYFGAAYSIFVLVLFAYFSARVVHTARKQRQMIRALEVFVSARAAAQRRKESHLAKMFVIIGIFYLLMVPYVAIAVYGTLLGAPDNKLYNILELTACLIAYLSACVCPGIYIYMDIVFRSEVKKLFRKGKVETVGCQMELPTHTGSFNAREEQASEQFSRGLKGRNLKPTV